MIKRPLLGLVSLLSFGNPVFAEEPEWLTTNYGPPSIDITKEDMSFFIAYYDGLSDLRIVNDSIQIKRGPKDQKVSFEEYLLFTKIDPNLNALLYPSGSQLSLDATSLVRGQYKQKYFDPYDTDKDGYISMSDKPKQ